ncbi:MAG: quercetin dioxygenase-like cupin family protein [Pseudohongiellaceae bacterium]|jgi:quercetin dioxygenase-like cupin family protein
MNKQRVLIGFLAVLGSNCLIGVSAVCAQADEFAGKRIVKILEEPRHRTVHVDDKVYLLDVQINPGDMTLPHTHDAAILYTFISNGEGPLFGRVSGNTDYVTENLTHQVSNEGPNLFRIIALTNYGAGLDSLSEGKAQGISSAPQVENQWFRSYRLTLNPGEETPIQTLSNPNVVVQVTEGKVHVTREDGITAELLAMGDWAWRDAQSPYKIVNLGGTAVEVVINEARR